MDRRGNFLFPKHSKTWLAGFVLILCCFVIIVFHLFRDFELISLIHQFVTVCVNAMKNVFSYGFDKVIPNRSTSEKPTIQSNFVNFLIAKPSNDFGSQIMDLFSLFVLAYINQMKPCLFSQLNPAFDMFKVNVPFLRPPVDELSCLNFQNHPLTMDILSNLSKYSFNCIEKSSFLGKFYYKYYKEVIEDLSFAESYHAVAQSYFYQLKQQLNMTNPIFIGIYIDEETFQVGSKFSLRKNDWSYLETAKQYFKKKYSTSYFLLQCKNITWCEKNIGNGNKDFILSPRSLSESENFAILAHCNHTIVTRGVFSTMAAVFAFGETVTFPDYWIIKNSKQKRSFDIYHQDFPFWIKIDLAGFIK